MEVRSAPRALTALEEAGQGPPEFLARRTSGDSGDLCQGDHMENQFRLERGCQILSSYCTDACDELWVITDNHFSISKIPLPDEY